MSTSNPHTTDIEHQNDAAAAAPPSSPTPDRTAVLRRRFPTWPTGGAKPIPLLACVAVGLIFRFAIPKPSRVSYKAWQLLAIFLASIAGLILGPLPIGGWAFACLTITVVTKTLTFAAAFAGFTNEVCENGSLIGN